jgi:2,4-dienoyl-CoA reductase-like NADH-dependent reductase (Old Yellow Enzyme family)
MSDILFEPLAFRSLTIKNRMVRSNISGRFDNDDASGNQVRINWELKFARGGVGAILSSFVAVTIRGRIVPNYATMVRDAIPFWRELGPQVHEHECKHDFVEMFASGPDRAPQPCTYSNRCLVNVIENPIGCYEEARYADCEATIPGSLSVFDPAPFRAHA